MYAFGYTANEEAVELSISKGFLVDDQGLERWFGAWNPVKRGGKSLQAEDTESARKLTSDLNWIEEYVEMVLPIVNKLLMMFGLFDIPRLIIASSVCAIICGIVYAVIYRVTSKAYYRIVS